METNPEQHEADVAWSHLRRRLVREMRRNRADRGFGYAGFAQFLGWMFLGSCPEISFPVSATGRSPKRGSSLFGGLFTIGSQKPLRRIFVIQGEAAKLARSALKKADKYGKAYATYLRQRLRSRSQ